MYDMISPNGCDVVSHCGLIYISLGMSDIDNTIGSIVLTILFLSESTKTHWLDSRGRLALPHTLCELVPSPLSFPVSNILLVSLSLPPFGSTKQKSEGRGTSDVVPFGVPGCRAGWGNKEMIHGRTNGTIYHSDILMTTLYPSQNLG